MGAGFDQREVSGGQRGSRGAMSPSLGPGKRTLVEQVAIQRSAGPAPAPTETDASAVQHTAAQGITGAGVHRIQRTRTRCRTFRAAWRPALHSKQSTALPVMRWRTYE
jgi:hypothetical protein